LLIVRDSLSFEQDEISYVTTGGPV